MEHQVMRFVVLFLATLWTVETYSDTTSCLPCFNFYLESCDGSMKYMIGQIQLGAEYMQTFDSCYGCSKPSAGDLPIIGGPNIKPGFNPVPGALVNSGITQPLLPGQSPNPYYGNPITGQNGFPNSGNSGPPGIPLAGGAIPNLGLFGIPSTVVNPISNPGSAINPGFPSTVVNPLSNPGSLTSPENPIDAPQIRSFVGPVTPGYPTANKIIDCEPVSQVATDILPVQPIQPVQAIPTKENIEMPETQAPNKAMPRMGPLPNVPPQINSPNIVPPIPQLQNIVPPIPQLQNIVPNPINFVPNNIPSFLPQALQPLNYLPIPQVPQIPNIFQNPPSLPFNNYGPTQGQGPAGRSFPPQNQPIQNGLPQEYFNYMNNYLYPAINPYIQPFYNGLQRYVPNVGMNLTAGPVQAGVQAGQPIHPNPTNLGVGVGANANLNVPNTPLNAGLNANAGLPFLPTAASLIANSNAKENITNSTGEENLPTPEYERVS